MPLLRLPAAMPAAMPQQCVCYASAGCYAGCYASAMRLRVSGLLVHCGALQKKQRTGSRLTWRAQLEGT